ncbi:MAG TPA: hypothetical protein P5141_01845, partial [Candidatus Hydrogenedentes bacterium]|nr:hypothetical protein [Candidatus Hydrogenedentota bacterium]
MTAPTHSGRLRRWAANAAAVLLGFLIVAIALAAAEGALRLKARLSSDFPPPSLEQYGQGIIHGKSILSYELTRDGTVRGVAKWGDQLIYSVSGRTD